MSGESYWFCFRKKEWKTSVHNSIFWSLNSWCNSLSTFLTVSISAKRFAVVVFLRESTCCHVAIGMGLLEPFTEQAIATRSRRSANLVASKTSTSSPMLGDRLCTYMLFREALPVGCCIFQTSSASGLHKRRWWAKITQIPSLLMLEVFPGIIFWMRFSVAQLTDRSAKRYPMAWPIEGDAYESWRLKTVSALFKRGKFISRISGKSRQDNIKLCNN